MHEWLPLNSRWVGTLITKLPRLDSYISRQFYSAQESSNICHSVICFKCFYKTLQEANHLFLVNMFALVKSAKSLFFLHDYSLYLSITPLFFALFHRPIILCTYHHSIILCTFLCPIIFYTSPLFFVYKAWKCKSPNDCSKPPGLSNRLLQYSSLGKSFPLIKA